MKCPLSQKDCLRDECEWWIDEREQCAIPTCVDWLENINIKLDSLDDSIIDLNEMSKDFVTIKRLNYSLGNLVRAIRKT
jgi:hypothetical protein